MADQLTKTSTTMWPVSDPAPQPSAAGRQFKTLWLQDTQLEAASCVPEEGTGAYELLREYNVTPLRQQRIPREYFKMPAEERDSRIWALRNQLGDRLVVLAEEDG